MRAVVFRRHGGPEVLELADVPSPEPGPGEVLVRVKAAGLNHLDVHVRRGIPGLKLPLPHIPGSDAAGVVERLGPGVDTIRTGTAVAIDPTLSCGACEFCAAGEESLCFRAHILGEHLPGTYAEFVRVPARNLFEMPTGYPFTDAAAAPLVFLTAWRMLMGRAALKEGETVLLMGASGGVASAGLQIAKLAGAKVFAVSSTPGKRAMAVKLGADVVIDPAAGPVAKQVRELTGKRGVDVVLEHVGGATFTEGVKSLRRGGRLVTCGATTGFDPGEVIHHVFWNQVAILGSTMANHREAREVMRRVFRGELKPVVDKVLPLERAADAHRLLEEKRHFGKVVLDLA